MLARLVMVGFKDVTRADGERTAETLTHVSDHVLQSVQGNILRPAQPPALLL